MEEQQTIIKTEPIQRSEEDWNKPQLTLLSVNQNTLGVVNSGADLYSSHS